MFQFSGFAPDGLCIQPPVTLAGYPVVPGCPIRTSPDQCVFAHSPELIAGCRVLHRLCTPRHPPYTLSSLTTFMKSCGQAAPSSSRETRVFPPAASRPPTVTTRIPASIPVHPTYELVREHSAISGQQSARSRAPAAESCSSQALGHPPDARGRTPHDPLFRSRVPARHGADRDRTGNLRVANAALSRLSYGPDSSPGHA